MIVLGIETSCDETSVSIVEKKKKNVFGRILSEQTLSQINKHKKFGGVVPELASREHSKNLDYLVKESIRHSNLKFDKIDAFAATTGPGLLGALLIGSNYAKALSLISKKPFISINHLQGHVLVSRMKKKISFPFLCLLVSGGHCQILLAEGYKKFKILGETLDDAIGEAYDKTAKILGLSYPGGPIIENLAKKSKGLNKFNLPKPLIHKNTLNFSFSGLKTSVRRIAEQGISDKQKCDLAYEFQNSVTECLIKKVKMAINLSRKKHDIKDFILTGGVASNFFIRNKLRNLCKKERISFYAPDKNLCLDNASMIAWAGIEMIQNGETGSRIHLSPKPRWRIDNL
ncbi:MAG: tRNA (adenosine(37)-N6)-threonylcarbamoyltransferase complex transferase subunit TsaD [Pseudomonadota bacterium]|nr:tRNA (adenosine(37)-N6)-threonylcarbamoyltransferase complex transferase subunit TsaD [Pseudomonadota bacterium]